MSPLFGADPFADIHGRARELAAIRLDEPLPAAEDAWLEEHLVGCEACTRVAVEYAEQTSLLAALRGMPPEPPRDLWARTAAAIEADAEPGRRGTGRAGWWRLGGTGRFPVAPVAGLLVVAIAVGAGLLNGINLFPSPDRTINGSGSPMPTPIAMTAGTVQVLSRGSDGVLELSTRHIDEVCPVGASSCGTTAASDSTRLSTLGDLGSIDAVISPTQDHIVVMQRGDKASGVFVVPVRETAQPSPGVPVATPTPVTASPSASVTPPPVSPTPTPTTDATATPTPTDTAASPTPTPTATATPEGSATPATPTAPPDASPSASLEVTPRPDGTIEIVHDVILVGSVSGYSADGTGFAFAARPADGSTGPDVYVWRTTDSQARSVTSDHASVFAGWMGDRLLVSRVTDGNPVTALLDAETGAEQAVAATSMWRPAVAADQRTAVWWDGTVAPAGDGFTWAPAVGRLVIGGWPGLVVDPQASPPAPAASPAASPADHSTAPDPGPTGVAPSSTAAGQVQVLASGTIRDWQVRWDETGTALALWVTDGAAGAPGTLSLYAVNAATGIVDLARPLLANAPAFDGFSLRDGRLAWSAPGEGGDTTVEVLAWSGTTVGQLQLPTETGVTVIH